MRPVARRASAAQAARSVARVAAVVAVLTLLLGGMVLRAVAVGPRAAATSSERDPSHTVVPCSDATVESPQESTLRSLIAGGGLSLEDGGLPLTPSPTATTSRSTVRQRAWPPALRATASPDLS